MAGLEWSLDRHRPAPGPAARGLVIVDDRYLAPDPREDLHQLPTQNQREIVAARSQSLMGHLARTSADLIVLCGGEARAGDLRSGRFVAAELDGNQHASRFPAIAWPGDVVLWPTKDDERPFGEFLPQPAGQGRRLYEVLRSVPPVSRPSPLDELALMVGMDDVRRQIEALEATVRVSLRRQRMGLPGASFRLHTALYGPPGTGKTTVARILGRVFAKLGLLQPGRFVEANREALVGAYIGQTEQKTREVCERALGGVLFIDEAYALAGSSDHDFGKQAIDSLIVWMENHKDRLAVIYAGYDDEMRRFMDANPGMHSRIQFHVTLRGYTDDELVSIAERVAARDGNVILAEAREILGRRMSLIRDECRRAGRPFGNGRVAENLVRAAASARDQRVQSLAVTREDLTLLRAEDFANAQL